MVGKTCNANCAVGVRVLTRVGIYTLEDRRGEAAEGVEDLTVLLSPDVRVILHTTSDVIAHADRVTAIRIGFGTNGLKDRLLAVSSHVFDHALRGGSLLTVWLIGNG